MEPRERHEEPQSTQPQSDGGTNAGNLRRLRAQGNAFLTASDDAIRRALSGNSEAFLRSNQQRGGQ